MRATPRRTKTPNGKFWIGKSLSGATAIHDSRRASVVSPGAIMAREKSERGQILDRLGEAAAAVGDKRGAPARFQLTELDALVPPAKCRLFEVKCAWIFFCDDPFAAFRTAAARRKGGGGQNIQKAVHREAAVRVDMTYRMMQACRRFERHARRSGRSEKLRDFIHAGKGLRRQSATT